MATGMSAFMWIAIMGMGTCIFIVRTGMGMCIATMVTGMCTARTGMVMAVTGRIMAGMGMVVVTAGAMDMVTARMVTGIEMGRGGQGLLFRLGRSERNSMATHGEIRPVGGTRVPPLR